MISDSPSIGQVRDLWGRVLPQIVRNMVRGGEYPLRDSLGRGFQLEILELGGSVFSPSLELFGGEGFDEDRCRLDRLCLAERTYDSNERLVDRVREKYGTRVERRGGEASLGYLRSLQSEAGAFHLVLLERSLAELLGGERPSDDLLVTALRLIEPILVRSGCLVVGDYHHPWNHGGSSQREYPMQPWPPSRLVQVATFESSVIDSPGRPARPLFRIKTREQTDLPRETFPNSYVVEDEILSAGGSLAVSTRYFLLAFEKTRERIDEAHLLEAADLQRREFSRLLPPSFDDLLGAAASDRGYEAALSQLLSPPGGRAGAYEHLCRSLFLKMVWDAYSIGINIADGSVDFWLAYQSLREQSMPARSHDDQDSVHGYGFGRGDLEEVRTESRARFWLDLILASDGFESVDGRVLKAPSVHEWFVRCQPSVRKGHRLQTLGVFATTKDNRRYSLLREYRAPANHLSIELVPYGHSEDGQYWACQLAAELASIPRKQQKDEPWPINEVAPVGFSEYLLAHSRETAALKRQVASGLRVEASDWWLQTQLYGVFLAAVLGSVTRRHPSPPDWILFFLDVLDASGFRELGVRVREAYEASGEFPEEESGQAPTSLLWIAPAESDPPTGASLGSALLVCSQLLPVIALRSVQEDLAAAFGKLRNLEYSVAGAQAKAQLSEMTGELAGIDQTVQGFSHEISKLTEAVFENCLRPIGEVLTISGLSRSEQCTGSPLAWEKPAGVLEVVPGRREQVSQWRIADTPFFLESLINVLEIWASARELRERLGLDQEQSFSAALRVISKLGVHAGVAAETVPTAGAARSFEQLEQLEKRFKDDVDAAWRLLGDVQTPRPELSWRGGLATHIPQMLFIRMMSAAVYNAVYHADWKKLDLSLAVTTVSGGIEVSLRNSFKAVDNLAVAPTQAGTRSVLRNCLQQLNRGWGLPTEPVFRPEKNGSRDTWLTRFVVSRVFVEDGGGSVTWLEPS